MLNCQYYNLKSIWKRRTTRDQLTAAIRTWNNHDKYKSFSALADPAERKVIEYSDRSLTVLWPRIITAKNGKKDIKSIAIMILWRNLD